MTGKNVLREVLPCNRYAPVKLMSKSSMVISILKTKVKAPLNLDISLDKVILVIDSYKAIVAKEISGGWVAW